MMKYVSDLTNEIYDTVDELEAAEKEYQDKQAKEDAKKAERADRAKNVQDAYAKVDEAKKVADNLLEKFLDDYGSYFTTVTKVPKTIDFLDLFDDLFRFF